MNFRSNKRFHHGMIGLAFYLLVTIAPFARAVENAPLITESLGQNSGRGNLVGIQPYFQTADFQTPQDFYARLDGYLKQAKSLGWLDENTLVLLPELIGLYVYFMNERPAVYEAEDLFAAATKMITRRILNPLKVGGLLKQPKGTERRLSIPMTLQAKFLRLKAPEVAAIYQDVMSRLAREYGITLIAGSVPLPDPSVSTDGELRVNKHGEMENVSLVFNPDGSLDPRITVKAHPIRAEEESLGTPMRSVNDFPVYETPAGRLGIAICADSWYPATYEKFASERIDILLVPGSLAGGEVGRLPWGGYNFAEGITAPDDFEVMDIGWITEWEAWRKYALYSRLARIPDAYGLTVFVKGELWGDEYFGAPIVVTPERSLQMENQNAATLINVWLAPREN